MTGRRQRDPCGPPAAHNERSADEWEEADS